MTKLKVLSLFAGIGGFDLGLERTGGFETVAFCEQDKKCQRVLAKHWPGVPCYDDVRTLTAEQLIAAGIFPNAIAAGFPCQDISTAGLGAGLEGERSGLFYEIIRIAGEFADAGHPIEVILLENVSNLLNRGLGDVLGALAALGFDAWWDCIPATAVGAPHRRDRIWILATNTNAGNGSAEQERQHQGAKEPGGSRARALEPLVANSNSQRGRGWSPRFQDAAYARQPSRHPQFGGWDFEPPVGRVANGVPGRVDRLKQLGNAVVPQIPELIGNAILASLAEQREVA